MAATSPRLAMEPTYNSWLVLTSIVVASLASYTALDLASRISASRGTAARTWLLGGAVSMGIGIWSMHFIGMLAVELPIQLGYEWGPTMASMAIAIGSSLIALYVATGAVLTWTRLAVAGSAMGLGIVSMHYVGMAALDMLPPIRYDRLMVAASAAIAIAASTSALWAAYRLRGSARWRQHARIGSALIMGLAIYGMHYTGMAAAHFDAGSVCLSSDIVDTPLLAGSVTAFTLFLLCATLLLSLIDARMTTRTEELASAQETNRAKDQFIAMLGHELRNPLAAISNATVLLEKSAHGDETSAFARSIIARQTAHLARLIDDLLDVGRVFSGKITLHPEPVELDRPVRDAIAALKASGRAARHEITTAGSPAFVLADRTRLEQVVTNLLLNAVTYTPPGGRIEVRTSVQGTRAVLVVSDTGIGIAASALPHVFDLFFQSGQEVYRSTGGLGIGLTLVKQIVEMHHGSVSAESEGPGRGTRVIVRLPAIARQEARVAPIPAEAGNRRHVVIVEDESDVRETLRILLQDAGHRVDTAPDGQSGLQAITEHRPDVAIVDIGLPGMSGYELAQALRSRGIRTRLIALSGYGTQEDRQRALDAGFDVHLAKPADIPPLMELVASSPARGAV